jgi:hypothetical protein
MRFGDKEIMFLWTVDFYRKSQLQGNVLFLKASFPLD